MQQQVTYDKDPLVIYLSDVAQGKSKLDFKEGTLQYYLLLLCLFVNVVVSYQEASRVSDQLSHR